MQAMTNPGAVLMDIDATPAADGNLIDLDGFEAPAGSSVLQPSHPTTNVTMKDAEQGNAADGNLIDLNGFEAPAGSSILQPSQTTDVAMKDVMDDALDHLWTPAPRPALRPPRRFLAHNVQGESPDVERSRIVLNRLSIAEGPGVFRGSGLVCGLGVVEVAHPLPTLLQANSSAAKTGANALPVQPKGPRRFLVPRSHRPQQQSHDTRRFIDAQAAWAVPGQYSISSAYTDAAYFDVAGGMADTERRGDYEGGRGRHGGGGGYFNGGGAGRKRRYRDDDEYDRRPQRREYREPLSVRVRKQIITIADSPMRNAQEDCAAIAALISDNHEDVYFVNSILQLLPQIVVEQPLKIPHVAAIVLNLNQKKSDLVGQALVKIGQSTQSALEAGELRSFKLLLRLLASLSALFEGEGVFAVLEELFNRAVDLQAASPEDAVGIEIVKTILLTIPYALATTAIGLEQKAAAMLERTDIVASAPQAADALISPYLSLGSEDAPQAQPVLSLLQKQLRSEAEKSWELSFMPRLFKDPDSEEVMNGDNEVNIPQKHPFPSVIVPATINPGSRALFPEVFFSMYADQDIETVPPTTSLASSILRDVLADTINILDFNRNAAAKYLVEMDCYFPPNTFARRATPFDKLKDAANEGQSTWKSEDMAVDAIFSQMLQLPAAEHKLVYYHSMITETCKIAPAAIAPSLGRAIRFLYKSLPDLDLELSYRVVDWFSHHLSNFDFRWKWVEWVDDVELSRLHPRKAFILAVLDKEVRLSFAKRVRETLPDPYQRLIPSSKDNDIPEYKYNDATTVYSTEAKTILGAIKKKGEQNDETLQTTLDAIRAAEAERDPSADPNLAATDAFITSLCYIGSKSLSHVLSYIERHKERLLALAQASPSSRVQIISSVVAYWRAVQAGVAVNIVDKLLNYGVLTPSSVLDWSLADPARLNAGRSLPDAYLYEMVAGTLAKVTGRVRQIATARTQPAIPRPQADALDATLAQESAAMRTLFATIDDALAPVADGSSDVMLEDGLGETVGEGTDTEVRGQEQLDLLKVWGAKWVRVFRRKLAVEDRAAAEAARAFPPPVEVGEDGSAAANGDARLDADMAVEAAGDDDADVV